MRLTRGIKMTTNPDDLTLFDELSTDDLYDMSFLVNRKCPVCGHYLVSHPTDDTTCSNDECNNGKEEVQEEKEYDRSTPDFSTSSNKGRSSPCSDF